MRPLIRTRTLRGRFALRAGLATLVISVAIGLATGLFWGAQVREAVRDGVAGHLRALAAELDLAPVSVRPGTPPVVLPAPEQFVQVIDLDGRVVAASSELAARGPLIDIDAMPGDSGTIEVIVDDPRAPGNDALVMAEEIDVAGARYIGVVGASLQRVESSRRLLVLLIGIGGPSLALLIGAGVWASVTYALRPVEHLAAEAEHLATGRGPWRIGVEPDTDELVRLAERFDDLLAHIGETFDRERRFLDDASHELRTPIAVARAELDLALGSSAGMPEVGDALRSSIQELDRLDRLAADLLVMARARGADRGSFTPCELGGIARRAAAGVMRGPGRRHVKVGVQGAAEVLGDPQALERVFVNLVSNAVDHARANVAVTLSSTGREAAAVVTDDGPGFPDEVLDHALLRFSRDRSRRGLGAGLGLAIAAEIVAAHGGSIEAATTADGGARVSIRLPTAKS